MVAVVAIGCQTPYRQGMGFTGGTRVQAVGPGAYVVSAQVNGFTSQGTAYEYAARRAAEVCPYGYQLADRTTGASTSYWRTSPSSVQKVDKPEVTLMVQCNEPRPAPMAAQPQAPIAMPAPPADSARWWCATNPDGTGGACQRELTACRQFQSQMVAQGNQLAECAPRDRAFCFAESTPIGGGTLACSSDATGCLVWRDFVVANPASGTVTSDCAEQR